MIFSNPITGILDAADVALTLGAAGGGGAGVQVSGVWVGTISFEGSLDGVTFVALPMVATATGVSGATTTANGVWQTSIAGLRQIRVRMSAFTSGAAQVQLHAVGVATAGTAVAGAAGPVTIADGADIAEGATTDVAWVAGNGTVISLLKKIAGSGGSAVSIADGSDVVEGTLADAAIITDAAGTVSGKLRGFVKWAFERMPAALGSAASAASLPVVIASDQGAVPVSVGSLPLPAGAATAARQDTGNTSLAAIDADLDVALSTRLAEATFTARINTQGQKAMAASTPVVLASDQTLSTKTDLTPSAPTVASVGIASAQALAANAGRTGLIVRNLSQARISLGFGAPAVLDSGVTLYPRDSFNMEEYDFDSAAVNAIASAAASPLAVQEYA